MLRQALAEHCRLMSQDFNKAVTSNLTFRDGKPLIAPTLNIPTHSFRSFNRPRLLIPAMIPLQSQTSDTGLHDHVLTRSQSTRRVGI